MWRQIRWRRAARLAGVIAACLVLLKLAPALLRPPDPPRLDPDVGLPRGAGIGTAKRAGETDAPVGKRPKPKRNGHGGGGDRHKQSPKPKHTGGRSKHSNRNPEHLGHNPPHSSQDPTPPTQPPSAASSPAPVVAAPAPASAPPATSPEFGF